MFLKSYSLGNLIRGYLKEEPRNLHHADADVSGLWRVLKKMVKKEKDDEALPMITRLFLRQVFGQDIAFSTSMEDGDFDLECEFENLEM